MRDSFDSRVLPPRLLALVRACQRQAAVTLGGGVALAGAHLSHRLSGDIDLVCRQQEELRGLVALLPEIAEAQGIHLRFVRDARTFVRAVATHPEGTTELDLLCEGTAPLQPPQTLEGIALESLADLRAAKLTCLLSRAEPRDLVDVLFLERAGFLPERDLPLAAQKDAGIDPGVLAWLLGGFPVRPLPRMLVALTEEALARYRDDLRERLRQAAVPRPKVP